MIFIIPCCAISWYSRSTLELFLSKSRHCLYDSHRNLTHGVKIALSVLSCVSSPLTTLSNKLKKKVKIDMRCNSYLFNIIIIYNVYMIKNNFNYKRKLKRVVNSIWFRKFMWQCFSTNVIFSSAMIQGEYSQNFTLYCGHFYCRETNLGFNSVFQTLYICIYCPNWFWTSFKPKPFFFIYRR